MQTLTIGALAQRGGVNLETIRYYEREGLMLPPPRKSSGHRAYAPGDLRRLRFIKRAKELGFSLAEIKELLALRRDPGQPCSDVIRRIEAKTEEVARKIVHLRAMRRALIRLKNSCEGECPMSECPILENLDSEVA